ncbi:hypothetical protein AB0D42_27865 [Streptomyces sp. NPDC048304]|uniref:hypothetical protein n=1 Tax=Streptomyces sp. NPDC048304 TaxID=3154820 RepID=UPI00340C49D6
MNDADRKAWCARHSITTHLVTDDHGTPQLVVDEAGMRAIADLAPNPDRAHALLDQWFAEADEPQT